MPRCVDKDLLEEIKAGARDLMEGYLNGTTGPKYRTNLISGKPALGLSTSKGVVWAVGVEANESVFGKHIRDKNLEVVSLRDNDEGFIYLPPGRQSDCACIVRMPDGRMKLTTYEGVLAL